MLNGGMTLRDRPVVKIHLQSDELEFLERLSRKRNATASEAKRAKAKSTTPWLLK